MLLLHKYEPHCIKDLLHRETTVNLLEKMLEYKYFNILVYGNEDSGKSTIINTLINECIERKIVTSNDVYNINNFQINTFIDYLTKLKTFCKCNANDNKCKFVVLENLDSYTEGNQQFIKHIIQSSNKNIFFLITASCINNIIEPIQSSLFQVQINGFDEQKFIEHFFNISKKEHINLNKNDVRAISKTYNYNYSGVISFFEQTKLSSNDSLDAVLLVTSDTLDKYFTHCKKQNVNDAYNILNKLYDTGFNTIDIIDEIYKYIKINHIYTHISSILCNYINEFSNGFDDIFQLYFITYEISNSFKQ